MVLRKQIRFDNFQAILYMLPVDTHTHSAHMLHQLRDHSVPLARHRILGAVLPVGHQVQYVVEADLARHPRQDVHAETKEALIARIVLAVVHLHVRRFLSWLGFFVFEMVFSAELIGGI